MLQGFEEQTSPLSDDERRAIPYVVAWLNNEATNQSRAITSKEMTIRLNRIFPDMNFPGPRIRKLINHIRRYRLAYPVVSYGKYGYWLGNPDEVAFYLISLRQRISAIQAIHDSFDPPDTSQLRFTFIEPE